MLRACASLLATLLIACASSPTPSAADRAAVWGYVRLVPRDRVAAITSGGASYGDREVADAQLVDYSKPGFAVVYADGAAPPPGRVQIAIRAGIAGAVFEPPHAALAAGGTIAVANESGAARVLSCPSAGLVRGVAPGESVEIAASAAGELELFLLDEADARAHVFSAPGPFAVVTTAGRFALVDLAPGPTRLHAWHPRFPAASTAADLAAGSSTRVDLELRVERPEEEPADAP